MNSNTRCFTDNGPNSSLLHIEVSIHNTTFLGISIIYAFSLNYVKCTLSGLPYLSSVYWEIRTKPENGLVLLWAKAHMAWSVT